MQLKTSEEITMLLHHLQEGKEGAYQELIPVVYKELRTIAHSLRIRFRGNETLNTTAIVHEAYLKMVKADQGWKNRAHFFCVAGKAMRQILINYALSKEAEKRGGQRQHLSIEQDLDFKIQVDEKTCKQLLQLEEALHLLEQKDQRQSRIVECRFFAGMSIEETAEALGVSPATVKRSWKTVRAWLYSQMSGMHAN